MKVFLAWDLDTNTNMSPITETWINIGGTQTSSSINITQAKTKTYCEFNDIPSGLRTHAEVRFGRTLRKGLAAAIDFTVP